MKIPPHIFVVDDDPRTCLQVSSYLEQQGASVLCFSDGLSFLNSEDTHAGVVLLDHHMPELSGLEVLEKLSHHRPHVQCIMMSGAADAALAVRAMKLGAKDFLEKPFSREALLTALGSAWDGAAFDAAEKRSLATANVAALSRREREVLQGVMSGYSNKDLAAALGVSVRTVEVHRAAMMKKLNVRSLSEALQIALAADLRPFFDKCLAA